jgi:hypothetical protein
MPASAISVMMAANLLGWTLEQMRRRSHFRGGIITPPTALN